MNALPAMLDLAISQGNYTLKLKAPFPYMGGKSMVVDEVWRRFGDVPNYIEPFCGSCAVLLSRPSWYTGSIETVNDAHALLSNFWRCLALGRDAEVAAVAGFPVVELEMRARHRWLVETAATMDLAEKLRGDPTFCWPEGAGWWVWGQSLWIGRGWCVERRLDYRQRPHLSGAGCGVLRQSVDDLVGYMAKLAARMKRVRVCCGDWSRVCAPALLKAVTPCGIFLDPPYSFEAGRDDSLYAVESGTVAHEVREWCLANGGNRALRIALCGYEGEHHDLEDNGWRMFAWKAAGGYGNQSKKHGNPNAKRERIWFSPGCIVPEPELWE